MHDEAMKEAMRRWATTRSNEDAQAAMRAIERSGVGSTVLIPSVGSILRLDEPWVFNLCPTATNHQAWRRLFNGESLPDAEEIDEDVFRYERRQATLPVGTALRIEVIDAQGQLPIRSSGVDAIGFAFSWPNGKEYFCWVAMAEFNKIVGTWDPITLPADHDGVIRYPMPLAVRDVYDDELPTPTPEQQTQLAAFANHAAAALTPVVQEMNRAISDASRAARELISRPEIADYVREAVRRRRRGRKRG